MLSTRFLSRNRGRVGQCPTQPGFARMGTFGADLKIELD
jgi:hypothetical protein